MLLYQEDFQQKEQMHALDTLETHNQACQNKGLLVYMSYVRLAFQFHDEVDLYEVQPYLQPLHLIELVVLERREQQDVEGQS